MNNKKITVLRITHDGQFHNGPGISFSNIFDLPVDIPYDECRTFESLLSIANSKVYPPFTGVTAIQQFCKQEIFTQYILTNPDSSKMRRDTQIEEIIKDFRMFLQKILPK